MTLITMGIQGSAMIVVVLILRACLLNRLPKATFCALWYLVALRLLVPICVVAPFGLWGLLDRLTPSAPDLQATAPAEQLSSLPIASPTNSPAPNVEPSATQPLAAAPTQPALLDPAALDPHSAPPLTTLLADSLPWWALVWIAGSMLCGLGFVVLYLWGRISFTPSHPVAETAAVAWLNVHPLRRMLSLRTCAHIATPMTRGIVRPVILVPPSFDWSSNPTAQLMLEHEYAHVQRFDALGKLLLALAACVHWFNPLVWTMYVMANRDIELACDAHVAQGLSVAQRASYARALLAAGSVPAVPITPLTSAFAKSSVEERVISIMKYRPASWSVCIVAAFVVLAVPAALATSAPEVTAPSATAPTDTPNTGIVLEGRPITSHAYTTEEWAAVEMLYRFADSNGLYSSSPLVSSPTIGDLRNAATAAFKGLDTTSLLARLNTDGWLLRQTGTNGMATFITMALVPLLADDWELHTFTGARSVHNASAEGLLTFEYSFAFSQATLDLMAPGDGNLANMGVGIYLRSALDLYRQFSAMPDAAASDLWSDPNAVMEHIDADYVAISMNHPGADANLTARYTYQARTKDGAWEKATLVGHIVSRVSPTDPLNERAFDHGLEEGSLTLQLPPEAARPFSIDTQWLAYESLGISRDPFTDQLFYQGEPVRLFVDGYSPGSAIDPSAHLWYYYSNPNGTLDICTVFDVIGTTTLSDGVAKATYRTPVRGIAELSASEARAIAEAYGPQYAEAFHGQMAAALFGDDAA